MTKGKLGLKSRNKAKKSPDCRDGSKKGRLLNIEKRDMNGDAKGQQKITMMLRLGKRGTLPKEQ